MRIIPKMHGLMLVGVETVLPKPIVKIVDSGTAIDQFVGRLNSSIPNGLNERRNWHESNSVLLKQTLLFTADADDMDVIISSSTMDGFSK